MASRWEFVITLSGYIICLVCWIGYVGSTDSEKSPAGTVAASYRSNPRDRTWQSFGVKEYLFVLDSEYRTDRTRSGAKRFCLSKSGDLVSIETEEELEFIKTQITSRVKQQKELLLTNERWWTNGMSYHQSHWVWDTFHGPQIQSSALKRRTVPREGVHYLALTHSGGWRLKIVPENYHLRYICERNLTKINWSPVYPGPTYRQPEELTPDELDDISRQLRSMLFDKERYDPDVPPEFTSEDSIIQMDIDLVETRDNVSKNALLVKQDIKTRWKDSRLSWSQDQFGGIAYLRYQQQAIWIPALKSITNNALVDTCHNSDPSELVTVSHDGIIVLDRTCDVIYNCTHTKRVAFPFDHKECLHLVLVEDNNGTIKMVWNANDTTEDMGFHSAWRVSSLDGYLVDKEHPSFLDPSRPTMRRVRLTLYQHHNVLYHIIILIVPCLFFSVMIIIVLPLPQGSGVKFLATIMVALAFVLYLVIGGQFRKGFGVSYTDMFMIVVSIIAIVSTVTQVVVIRMVRTYKQRLPPPLWIERAVMKRSQNMDKNLENHQSKYKDKKSVNKDHLVCDKFMDKWMEEKELMLGDNSLGLTSLGQDAKPFKSQNQYVTRPSEEQHSGKQSPEAKYSTVGRYTPEIKYRQREIYTPEGWVSPGDNHNPQDRYVQQCSKVGIHNKQDSRYSPKQIKSSNTLPHSSQGAMSSQNKYPNHNTLPNGTANKGYVKRPAKTVTIQETCLFHDAAVTDIYADRRFDMTGISTGEDSISGCQSSVNTDPDVTLAGNMPSKGMKDTEWKKCIVWFDRAVSLIISAAVIFTIMIFTILFLAT